ncbi:unnamed protein product [Amoebophrya sp. A120]|nr:unnamed protein product [Amoebophrya sp. A120]|eukprot:GSA120T00008282001.1
MSSASEDDESALFGSAPANSSSPAEDVVDPAKQEAQKRKSTGSSSARARQENEKKQNSMKKSGDQVHLQGASSSSTGTGGEQHQSGAAPARGVDVGTTNVNADHKAQFQQQAAEKLLWLDGEEYNSEDDETYEDDSSEEDSEAGAFHVPADDGSGAPPLPGTTNGAGVVDQERDPEDVLFRRHDASSPYERAKAEWHRREEMGMGARPLLHYAVFAAKNLEDFREKTKFLQHLDEDALSTVLAHQDPLNRTALHCACIAGKPEFVKAILWDLAPNNSTREKLLSQRFFTRSTDPGVEKGVPLLHMALSTAGFKEYEDAAIEIVKHLLRAAAEVDAYTIDQRKQWAETQKLETEAEKAAVESLVQHQHSGSGTSGGTAAPRRNTSENKKANKASTEDIVTTGGADLVNSTTSSSGDKKNKQSGAPLPQLSTTEKMMAVKKSNPSTASSMKSKKEQIVAINEDTDGNVVEVAEVDEDMLSGSDAGEELFYEDEHPCRPDILFAVDAQRQTALHLACDIGSAKAVKLLLREGLDPLDCDKANCMPIHYAIDRQCVETFDTIASVTPLEYIDMYKMPKGFGAIFEEYKKQGTRNDINKTAPGVVLGAGGAATSSRSQKIDQTAKSRNVDGSPDHEEKIPTDADENNEKETKTKKKPSEKKENKTSTLNNGSTTTAKIISAATSNKSSGGHVDVGSRAHINSGRDQGVQLDQDVETAQAVAGQENKKTKTSPKKNNSSSKKRTSSLAEILGRTTQENKIQSTANDENKDDNIKRTTAGATTSPARATSGRADDLYQGVLKPSNSLVVQEDEGDSEDNDKLNTFQKTSGSAVNGAKRPPALHLPAPTSGKSIKSGVAKSSSSSPDGSEEDEDEDGVSFDIDEEDVEMVDVTRRRHQNKNEFSDGENHADSDNDSGSEDESDSGDYSDEESSSSVRNAVFSKSLSPDHTSSGAGGGGMLNLLQRRSPVHPAFRCVDRSNWRFLKLIKAYRGIPEEIAFVLKHYADVTFDNRKKVEEALNDETVQELPHDKLFDHFRNVVGKDFWEELCLRSEGDVVADSDSDVDMVDGRENHKSGLNNIRSNNRIKTKEHQQDDRPTASSSSAAGQIIYGARQIFNPESVRAAKASLAAKKAAHNAGGNSSNTNASTNPDLAQVPSPEKVANIIGGGVDAALPLGGGAAPSTEQQMNHVELQGGQQNMKTDGCPSSTSSWEEQPPAKMTARSRNELFIDRQLHLAHKDEAQAPNRTWVVTHEHCYGHGQIPGEDEAFPENGYFDCDDPGLRAKVIGRVMENPHRLEVLCAPEPKGCLRSSEFKENLVAMKEDSRDCPRVDMLRCHDDYYLQNLETTVQRCVAKPDMMERQFFARHGNDPRLKEYISQFRESQKRRTAGDVLTLDKGDTKVTQFSYQAARKAAGCVLEAVDLIMSGKADNAFCAVRPPGHHMGPRGAVDASDLADDPEGSQGFCLLNNVAIGAAYARCCYRQDVKRVAIVDFDVHHGNGTEAVVRNICPTGRREASKYSRVSTHFGEQITLHSKPPRSSKPWLDPQSDANEVFFASIHGFGGGFYPGTGETAHTRPSLDSPEVVNIGVHVARDSTPGANSTTFRANCVEKLFPKLRQFRPDMLFISAGFDGHREDLIGQCNYRYEDFTWVTEQLMCIANSCSKGRVVSVLEGGYNTRAGYLSPFARSVRQHVRVLMRHGKDALFLEDEKKQERMRTLRKDIFGEEEALKRENEAEQQHPIGPQEDPSSLKRKRGNSSGNSPPGGGTTGGDHTTGSKRAKTGAAGTHWWQEVPVGPVDEATGAALGW